MLLWWMAMVAAAPTFTKDVAPILYKHCASCHRPGEVAPFPLLSYSDAVRRSKQIAQVVRSGVMPPWKPVTGYGNFQKERRLSAAELQLIQRWAASGANEGTVALDPPRIHENSRAQADLTVRVPREYQVRAEGPDEYRCFVIPLTLDRDRYVEAVDFRPSNRRVVHHALFFIDKSRVSSRLQNEADSYSCFGTPGFLPSGSLGGWSPGNGQVTMYPDTAVLLPRNASLVIQEHFHSTGKPEVEQSTIGLYFTDQHPTKAVADVGLVSRDIDIPPGVASYKVRDHFTIPVNVHAVGIIPHAHYLARDVKGWAILPNGRKQWLLWIRDWDFNWQDHYRYAEPIALPADTRVEMEFTFDNSARNPRNPNSPPKRVVWGPGSADEMAGLHIQVIPDRMEDMPELGRALWGKIMRMVGGRFFK